MRAPWGRGLRTSSDCSRGAVHSRLTERSVGIVHSLETVAARRVAKSLERSLRATELPYGLVRDGYVMISRAASACVAWRVE